MGIVLRKWLTALRETGIVYQLLGSAGRRIAAGSAPATTASSWASASRGPFRSASRRCGRGSTDPRQPARFDELRTTIPDIVGMPSCRHGKMYGNQSCQRTAIRSSHVAFARMRTFTATVFPDDEAGGQVRGSLAPTCGTFRAGFCRLPVGLLHFVISKKKNAPASRREH